MAEKNSAQTNKQTNRQTDRQTDRHYENNGHLAVNQKLSRDRATYGVRQGQQFVLIVARVTNSTL